MPGKPGKSGKPGPPGPPGAPGLDGRRGRRGQNLFNVSDNQIIRRNLPCSTVAQTDEETQTPKWLPCFKQSVIVRLRLHNTDIPLTLSAAATRMFTALRFLCLLQLINENYATFFFQRKLEKNMHGKLLLFVQCKISFFKFEFLKKLIMFGHVLHDSVGKAIISGLSCFCGFDFSVLNS